MKYAWQVIELWCCFRTKIVYSIVLSVANMYVNIVAQNIKAGLCFCPFLLYITM